MNRLREQILALGRIVTVWAHPDDEAYLAAGLMSVARDLGLDVTCIIATDGDFAESAAERAQVGRNRLAEAGRALDTIGVHDRVFLHLPDGGCADLNPTAPVATIERLIADRAPDTVVTFGPDGLTGHPDHRAVSRWTLEAVRSGAPACRLLQTAVTDQVVEDDRDINDRFPIFENGFPVTHPKAQLVLSLELEGLELDRKMEALRCHDSQTRGLIEAIGPERYRRWIARELFVDASPHQIERRRGFRGGRNIVEP